MKKILTFCAAVLASVSMWAATETVPKFSDNWTGTSISFTNNEGANGSSDQKKDGDAEKVTYVKFRTNKNGNTITLNVTDGYKVTGLYLRGYTNDASTSVSLNSVKYDDADAITTNLEFPLSGAGTTATYENNTDVARNAIVLQMSNSGKQLMAVLRVTYSLDCNAPATPLSITSDAPETLYAGTVVNLSIDGGNGATPVLLLDGEAFEGTAWTAVAGEHTFSVSQAEYEGYCAQEDELELTVLASDAVESVTIDGPTAAYVGEAVTFTATAANASDYAWTVNGVDANTNAAEFTYTPAAAGEYSIVCSARNKFNAANEWIASDAKVLTASNVSGVLVSYTVNSDANGAANLSGALAAKATAKVSLTKGSSQALDEYTGYKMDKGKYVGVTLTSGKFAEGDTVSFMVTKASGTAKLYLYDDEQGTNRLDSIDFNGQTGWATFVLNQATAGVYLYRSNPDVKPYDQNPFVAALKVIRPKAVDHADVALVGVAIDGEALLPDFVTHLINEGTFTIQTSYVNAPVVAFVKQTDTYYEGETEPVSTNDSIKVTATEVEGEWQAQATIGENTYTITLAKTASVVVTYMDGETVLGTENVAANGNPANYAQYQSKSLASFVGWYNNADLADEHAVADMSAEVITAATTYYAKFENKYAVSVNIEKLILDNSKDYDVKANVLNGTNGYASNYNSEGMDITNDSLNNSKGAMRNYAYLGLKIKSKSLLNFRVAQGQTVLIKFGNVATTPQVSINGGEYAAMTITEGVYSYTATGDDLLSMYVSEANKAVVLKQIVIGEAPALEDVVYDINCGEVQNGTLACDWAIALPGETVALTVTPAEGYKVENVTLNGETVEAVENVYSFIMPEKVANVAATFVKDTPSALGNTEAEAKAVKVVRDGQLLILKNGVLYNAQGAVVK